MKTAPLHPQEDKRLATLYSLGLLDTPIERRFERITRMAKQLMNVPITIFNLIDEDRQHYKSVQGLSVIDAPRPPAFCTHAILEEDMLLVPDASKDERFHDNPFVSGELLNIGFYAGCVVRAPDGMPIGTLCAIDTKPRDYTRTDLQFLRDLADMIETELKVIGLSASQTSLIKELDDAKKLAMIDPMTRLWNRSGINALLEKEMAESIRQKKPLALVITDIDHFKKVNDTYGHPVGDAVITGAAKRLLDGLRNEDVIGRIGGEEFMIILTDANADALKATVERLRLSIEKTPIFYEGKDYNITMSFGATIFTPKDMKEADQKIKLADEALYVAKNAGRNKVEVL